MGYRASTKLGRVRATETDTLFVPGKLRGATKRGVVLLHGAGTPREWTDGGGGAISWSSAEMAPRLAAEGIPSVGAEMSKDSFGNAASMTDIGNAITLLGTSGCATDKVHLFCVSMGGSLALRYAALNPGKVASISGIMPLDDVKWVYDNDPGGAGLRAIAGTAWGVTYPTAAPAGMNLPANSYPAIAAAGIPNRWYYATSDTLIPSARTIAMATALGGQSVDLGSPYGHSEYTVNYFMQLRFNSYVEWIKGLGA